MRTTANTRAMQAATGLVLALSLVSATASADSSDYDLVIVGAGPGGSVGALEAVAQARAAGQAPPRILIVEKRDAVATRRNLVGAHPQTLRRLSELGVDIAAIGVEFLDSRVIDQRADKAWQVETGPRAPVSGPAGLRAPGQVSDLYSKTSIPNAFFEIRQLENAVRRAAERLPSVTIVYNATVAGDGELAKKDSRWQLDVKSKAGNRRVAAKHLVGADGARGGMRSRLGVERVVPRGFESLRSRRIVGFGKVGGPDARFFTGWDTKTVLGDGGSVTVQRGQDFGSVLVDAPDGVALDTPQQVEAYYTQAVRAIGLSEGDLRGVEGPRLFTMEPTSANAVVDAKDASYFLIGDGIRTVHASTVRGLQFALRDGARVADALVRLRKGESRESVARRYAAQTRRASMSLLRLARPFYQRRTGVRTRPRTPAKRSINLRRSWRKARAR